MDIFTNFTAEVFLTGFTSWSAWDWTLWRDQKVIFVKSGLSALQSHDVNMRKMQTCAALLSQPKPVSLFFAVNERYVYKWRFWKDPFTLDRPMIRIYWRKPAAIGKFENWTMHTVSGPVNQILLKFEETGFYGVKTVITGVFNNTEKNFTLDESTLRVSRGKQATSTQVH